MKATGKKYERNEAKRVKYPIKIWNEHSTKLDLSNSIQHHGIN